LVFREAVADVIHGSTQLPTATRMVRDTTVLHAFDTST
jgi:hypothetical protein